MPSDVPMPTRQRTMSPGECGDEPDEIADKRQRHSRKCDPVELFLGSLAHTVLLWQLGCAGSTVVPLSVNTSIKCRRLRQQAASSLAIAFGFPATLRTRPWTGRRLDTNADPGLSRCSTPPDPRNRIHSRRPDLYGGGLGTTEPLDKSRCHLLWSQTDGESERKHTEKTDGSLFKIAQLLKLRRGMRSKANWTVAGKGLVRPYSS